MQVDFVLVSVNSFVTNYLRQIFLAHPQCFRTGSLHTHGSHPKRYVSAIRYNRWIESQQKCQQGQIRGN